MSERRSLGFTTASVPEAYDRYVRPQLFDPWARELLSRAGLREGASVLDVACGPGTVAHLAAAHVGSQGRVLATDISAGMLAVASARPVEPGAAPIEYLECSAQALDVPVGAFDGVLCQQGLQFFPHRPLALAEMRRTIREGGTAALGVWSADHPLGLFGPMAESLAELGLPEPYRGAFDPVSYTMAAGELRELLEAAGFAEVNVETVHIDCVWASSEEALAGIGGTPFGPAVASLPEDTREALRAGILRRLGDPAGEVRVRTSSNIALART